ncbi:hypothetical protein [Amycolatopsis anabasis]|uniref:hypothetical protein n=1 Tax=Amycolatopsis anabasis TaxID=1840409 RepID=UPI00131C0E9C|nr:hypothetical protein [Amycolatopsis anabasis]
MTKTKEPGDHDGKLPDWSPDGRHGLLGLAKMVLGDWAPALRAALLLIILILGAAALIAVVSPWISIPVLGAGGYWITARRARRK